MLQQIYLVVNRFYRRLLAGEGYWFFRRFFWLLSLQAWGLKLKVTSSKAMNTHLESRAVVAIAPKFYRALFLRRLLRR